MAGGGYLVKARCRSRPGDSPRRRALERLETLTRAAGGNGPGFASLLYNSDEIARPFPRCDRDLGCGGGGCG